MDINQEEKSKSTPFDFWILAYALGVILLPPVSVAGKNIFAAEWMLIPLLILLVKKIWQKRVTAPPPALWVVWTALVICFFAGMSRADVALSFSPYWWGFKKDSFEWIQDTTRLARWALLFSLPWMIAQFRQDRAGKTWSDHFETFRWVVLVSACLAVSELFFGLNLNAFYNCYGIEYTEIIRGRSCGTFQSPIDAGIIYAAFFVQHFSQIKKRMDHSKALALIYPSILLLALAATHSGTAVVACAAAGLILLATQAERKQRLVVLASLVLGLTIIFLFFRTWLSVKIGDYFFRTGTWIKWLSWLKDKPLRLLVGLGFTNLIMDNSILWSVATGGVLLLGSLFVWIKKLFKSVPGELVAFYAVWVFSWLASDSIGYWGIARIGWLFLGLII